MPGIKHTDRSGVFQRKSSNQMPKDILPPFGLQRNRNTPERTTIGKPVYFCSPEFVGQFLAWRRVADQVLTSIRVKQMNKLVPTLSLGPSRLLTSEWHFC
jgi:hypothetical protein